MSVTKKRHRHFFTKQEKRRRVIIGFDIGGTKCAVCIGEENEQNLGK